MAAATPRTEQGQPALRTVAILPARLASTRLERKMLLAETGKPLVVHSAHNVARCSNIDRVVVATDSEEIAGAARPHGVEVLLTNPDHPSGTDRVREAHDLLRAAGEAPFDVVLNVQGDEPDVRSADLVQLIAAFEAPEVEFATLCGELPDEERDSASVVKVVRDALGDALYFSRAALPDTRHARAGAALTTWRHIGVYAFRPAALARFCELPIGELEAAENLEQLRWLEAGGKLRVLVASHVPAGIDTREDYEAFVAHLSSDSNLERSETR